MTHYSETIHISLVSEAVKFKLCLLIYKAFHRLGPKLLRRHACFPFQHRVLSLYPVLSMRTPWCPTDTTTSHKAGFFCCWSSFVK